MLSVTIVLFLLDITDNYPRGEDGHPGHPGALGQDGEPGGQGQDGQRILVRFVDRLIHPDGKIW